MTEKLKEPLMIASLLHDVGRYVSAESSHKHTFYLLNNTEFPFLTEKERLFVATLARPPQDPPRSGYQGFDDMEQNDKKNLNGLASIPGSPTRWTLPMTKAFVGSNANGGLEKFTFTYS